MTPVGIIKGEIIYIDYLESERYCYHALASGRIDKVFYTNGMDLAFAKVIHDFGFENIHFCNYVKRYLKEYLEQEELFESDFLEHFIGLDTIDIKKRKMFNAFRNSFSMPIGAIDKKVDIALEQNFIKKMDGVNSDKNVVYYLTWQGAYWLECKHDIKIKMGEWEK